MSSEDYIDIYKRYLEKFENAFGPLSFEEFAKHGGQLIKKLRYDEFVVKWTELKKIEDYLREVMTKGATLNDEIYRTYRELSAYVLEKPKDFLAF
ncbi:MAG: hypothetical protein PHU25_16910 [Deltaproteobacteria bacterium]|nr:hypothetical protein [Deltaproteobacteria bacterium]